MSTTSVTGAEPPEVWGRIVEAIASGPSAWMSPAEVASAIGLDEEATLDELASMDVAGLLSVWERPEGIVVTFSALLAERLGYQLVEYGAALRLRWARAGDPLPPQPRASHVVRSNASAGFSVLVDPHPGPCEEVESSEQAARFLAAGAFGTVRRGAGRGEPPRPTLLIGTGLVPWPGPAETAGHPCPACGSSKLSPNAYCICCDRWGLDPDDRLRRPARNPAGTGFRHPDQSPDSDRIHRKKRRQMKMALRIERDRLDRKRRRERFRSG